MRIFRLIVLAFFLLFGQPLLLEAGEPCYPVELSPYFDAEKRILQVKSPWRSVPLGNTRRVFYSRETGETWVSGFSLKELGVWRGHAQECDNPGLYRLDGSIKSVPPANGLFQPYSKGPNTFRPDDLALLSDRSDYPFVKISIPPSRAIAEKVMAKSPEIPLAVWSVKVLFHEEFHKFQPLLQGSRIRGGDSYGAAWMAGLDCTYPKRRFGYSEEVRTEVARC
ncbi:MAG: hypothetical protein P4M08_00640 [Oligoflexia bacterium]|nr:hypothetical protein [Oligoflexia bacterium]